MNRLTPNKKYKISWIDIHSVSEWQTKMDALSAQAALIQAVYIYVGKTKEGHYCFAGEYSDGDYGNVTYIPKGNIKKITQIK